MSNGGPSVPYGVCTVRKLRREQGPPVCLPLSAVVTAGAHCDGAHPTSPTGSFMHLTGFSQPQPKMKLISTETLKDGLT